ncbi:C-5 sterol desaturase [Seminavis robusta]|uniref:C-5 sterol desaturase n=1 Tax=Seminavis robusta TaxID=568900 RepID=A0A9N8DNW1_9STRA|nr:C-5 sterol desaturase [Seminavis robusta]|eukprot:Sro250_g098960.1 C-5 sterol desaturase (395) ;mRNA; r:24284-25561
MTMTDGNTMNQTTVTQAPVGKDQDDDQWNYKLRCTWVHPACIVLDPWSKISVSTTSTITSSKTLSPATSKTLARTTGISRGTTDATKSGAAPKMPCPRNQWDKQQLQSILFDLLTTVAVGCLSYKYPGLVNPWEMSLVQWLIGAALLRGLVCVHENVIFVLLAETVVGGRKNLLPTRTTPKPVRTADLDAKSCVYLMINTFDEWVYFLQLGHFLWHSPHTPLQWQEFHILSLLGSLAIMFIVQDLWYAPMHHLMHQPWNYSLIHKHHHREHYPTRGYWDAINEHPIEHFVLGVGGMWIAILAATYGPTGAHGISIFLFVNIHAILGMFNHAPYDVEFDVIPGLLRYKSGNHEMHHRKFTINYAQHLFLYDNLVGTFAPYEGPPSVAEVEKEKES